MTFIWRGSHIKAFSRGDFIPMFWKGTKKLMQTTTLLVILSLVHFNEMWTSFQSILETKNTGTKEMKDILQDWRRREAAWLSARSGFLWKEDPGVAAFLFCFSWPSRSSTWDCDRLCHQQDPQNVNGRQNWRLNFNQERIPSTLVWIVE